VTFDFLGVHCLLEEQYRDRIGLALLGKLHLIDSQSAIRWLVNRQMSFEGGFQVG